MAALESATAAYRARRGPLRYRSHRLAHIPPHVPESSRRDWGSAKVQQELMRHADIRTTMNIYGKAMEKSKREAHGKVVRLVLASQVA